MREGVQNPPILSFLSGMKGLIAGGLMALALFTSWDPVGRIVLFIMGFISLIDSTMPVDRKLYAVTSMFFLIVGGLIGFFTAVSGSGLVFLVALLIITAVVYLDKIRRMRDIGRIR